MSPLAACRGLSVTLGGRPVLTDVSLALHASEILGVVGRSGEGKTTLLRALLGLAAPSAGTVELGGEDLWAAHPRRRAELRRQVAIVFQGAALFDSLTVAENVGFFPTRVARTRSADVARLVSEKLRLVGLDDIEGLRPSQLSGGMAKRVGIARALAMEPRAILFDEPTAMLDPVARAQLEELIVSLRDRVGCAAVVVSHDLESVARMADRIALLHDGTAALELPSGEFVRSLDPRVREMVAPATGEEGATRD